MGDSFSHQMLKISTKIDLTSQEEIVNMKDFAAVLRYERSIRGWSQADVAEKVGRDSRTVRRWERGKTVPTPYLRQKLCQLLGKTPTELGLLPGLLSYLDAEEEAKERFINDSLERIP